MAIVLNLPHYAGLAESGEPNLAESGEPNLAAYFVNFLVFILVLIRVLEALYVRSHARAIVLTWVCERRDFGVRKFCVSVCARDSLTSGT